MGFSVFPSWHTLVLPTEQRLCEEEVRVGDRNWQHGQVATTG